MSPSDEEMAKVDTTLGDPMLKSWFAILWSSSSSIESCERKNYPSLTVSSFSRYKMLLFCLFTLYFFCGYLASVRYTLCRTRTFAFRAVLTWPGFAIIFCLVLGEPPFSLLINLLIISAGVR